MLHQDLLNANVRRIPESSLLENLNVEDEDDKVPGIVADINEVFAATAPPKSPHILNRIHYNFEKLLQGAERAVILCQQSLTVATPLLNELSEKLKSLEQEYSNQAELKADESDNQILELKKKLAELQQLPHPQKAYLISTTEYTIAILECIPKIVNESQSAVKIYFTISESMPNATDSDLRAGLHANREFNHSVRQMQNHFSEIADRYAKTKEHFQKLSQPVETPRTGFSRNQKLALGFIVGVAIIGAFIATLGVASVIAGAAVIGTDFIIGSTIVGGLFATIGLALKELFQTKNSSVSASKQLKTQTIDPVQSTYVQSSTTSQSPSTQASLLSHEKLQSPGNNASTVDAVIKELSPTNTVTPAAPSPANPSPSSSHSETSPRNFPSRRKSH